MITIDQLNQASELAAVALLDGTYEHSPWVAQEAIKSRPFASLASVKQAMLQAVELSSLEAQLALIRVHPELAGKAMVSNTLTSESTNEQSKAGLTDCSPEEFARLQQLNKEYNDKFGFPFILAVRGPRGIGLDRQEIIATFARRLSNTPDFERAECLRNIHRIAEIRLNDKFGFTPTLGNQVWDWAEQLAQFSDPGYAERGELTVTYLTDAHRHCAAQLQVWMRECGFDEVSLDAVGNVLGIYHGTNAGAPRLLTGSHYDTVRNGGKYDGRLGIFVPMACVQQLHQENQRLPFGIEVVGFAEEEGQRFKATFLGSGALIGQFDTNWLTQQDCDGVTMQAAMEHAGLKPADIGAVVRNPKHYKGFIEVHIEQGPVLNQRNLPLGVVTSINGSRRFQVQIHGMASHAGTTPMHMRKDAALAAAELILFLEKRAASQADVVGTVGMLAVPNGSINVVPGRCDFSLDIRATTDGARDACVEDTLTALNEICTRRGLAYSQEETMRARAAPSAPEWQARWESAVSALGLPVFLMPSGAGHDAMKLHEAMPQAMLFTRGLNAGISHNPLESCTNDDCDLTVRAFAHLLQQLSLEGQ
jgi:beta-ureidopropionase / N-carbamoyl-L-amino-acid hydrolase